MVPAAAAGTAATASMDRASAVETRALFTGFLLFVGSDRPLRERMPSMLDWRRFLPFFCNSHSPRGLVSNRALRRGSAAIRVGRPPLLLLAPYVRCTRARHMFTNE